jgi:hypothetical protein
MAEIRLKQALKEWDVAIAALIAGETILLMRKGGTREPQAQFVLPTQPVLLYPTYEHQMPALLKPAYANRVEPVPSGWHPAQVTMRAMAQITDVFELDTGERLASLLPFHIWNQRFAIERWRWKPQDPLLILCLRVLSLPQSQVIPYQSHYGGCRSWIELAQPVDITDARPVLNQAEYDVRVAQIRSICQA